MVSAFGERSSVSPKSQMCSLGEGLPSLFRGGSGKLTLRDW